MPETFIAKQSAPSATTLTDLYTVPASTKTAVSKVVVCNRSGTATSFRISVAPLGAADANSQYLYFDCPIGGNETAEVLAGLSLTATDKVRIYATLATLSFSLFGDEVS